MFIYKYYPHKKLILTVFYGKVTTDEIHQVIDELREINLKEDNMCGLTVFCKKAKPSKIKVKDIMNMGERMQKICYGKTFKNAFITKTLVAYGLARIYKMVLDIMTTDEMKIYKENEFAKAIQWLDVSGLEEEIKDIVNNCEKIAI